MEEYNKKTPRWFLWVVIILMLPLLAFPWLISAAPSGTGMFVWFYPIYVVTSGWLAYNCYVSRREIAYILLVLMVLSHVSMWMLPQMV